MLYRRAQSADLIQGRSIEMIAAASVYAACRCRGIHRTVTEVAEVTNRLDRRSNWVFASSMQNSAFCHATRGSRADPPTRNGLRRVGCRPKTGTGVAELAEESGIANGRNLAGVAAGCVYLACREFDSDLTQEELAAEAHVTPATLRRRYNELQHALS